MFKVPFGRTFPKKENGSAFLTGAGVGTETGSGSGSFGAVFFEPKNELKASVTGSCTTTFSATGAGTTFVATGLGVDTTFFGAGFGALGLDPPKKENANAGGKEVKT
jgi:hypothetical protein